MTSRAARSFGFLGPQRRGQDDIGEVLLGLLRPTTGEAWLLGEPLVISKREGAIGHLPELFRYRAG